MTIRAAAAAALLATAGACAQPADTLAQRALACTGCHGKEGRAAADGFHPRIAGKPAGYLFQQLLAFRDGRRSYAPMTALIDPLSDAFLRELAGHFAALELPYPAPQPPTVPAPVLQQGQRLVAEGDPARRLPACAACHGSALTGVQPAVPGLLGLPRDYLIAQLGAWRTGQRRAAAPDCMADVARTLRPDEITALAQWLASQRVPQPAHAAAALPQPMPLDCGSVR